MNRAIRILLLFVATNSASAQPVPTADDDPARIADAEAHYPKLVTDATLASPQALAALETSGKVLFADGFESPDALKSYFEVLGLPEGRVKLTTEPTLAHSGAVALELIAPANGGRSIGAGPCYWFGPDGPGPRLPPLLPQVRRRLRPGQSQPHRRWTLRHLRHAHVGRHGLRRHPPPRR
jgi:hypothetical protein